MRKAGERQSITSRHLRGNVPVGVGDGTAAEGGPDLMLDDDMLADPPHTPIKAARTMQSAEWTSPPSGEHGGVLSDHWVMEDGDGAANGDGDEEDEVETLVRADPPVALQDLTKLQDLTNLSAQDLAQLQRAFGDAARVGKQLEARVSAMDTCLKLGALPMGGDQHVRDAVAEYQKMVRQVNQAEDALMKMMVRGAAPAHEAKPTRLELCRVRTRSQRFGLQHQLSAVGLATAALLFPAAFDEAPGGAPARRGALPSISEEEQPPCAEGDVARAAAAANGALDDDMAAGGDDQRKPHHKPET